MKTTVGPETDAVSNVEISAELAGANAQSARGPEILFVDPAVSVKCENTIGENEVARLQSTRKGADDAGTDHQLRAGYQIESAPRGFGCATMTDAMADDRKLLAVDLRTEAVQAIERERCASALPALERRDLAREGVEDNYQSRDLDLISRPACLSQCPVTSKIVPVLLFSDPNGSLEIVVTSRLTCSGAAA